MQSFTLALTAATVATAMAAPAPQVPAGNPNPDLVTFGVISIASGSKVQNAGWGAMHKGLFTGAKPQEGASCYGPAQDFATFVLNKPEGTLSLLTDGKPWQQLFVDRSGMGQGMMQYTTGAEPAPRNAERDGWAINDEQHLTFGGSDGFLACPAGEADLYRVLPYVGIDSPAGYTNCTSIAARVVVATNPVQCLYSQE
ncbi:cell wall protein PhiA [Apiospora saccharicola]|uniref:Cell wall protein PhiA n=1 Tax=Apiospora saccharicola TaxID=335842 RepID=A0ABR1TH89_9PEZI